MMLNSEFRFIFYACTDTVAVHLDANYARKYAHKSHTTENIIKFVIFVHLMFVSIFVRRLLCVFVLISLTAASYFATTASW